MKRPAASDLILGMTLAEIFLLLLFVVWWSTTIAASESGPESPTVQVAVLQAENEKLKKRVRDLEAENTDLAHRLEQLRAMLGAPTTKLRDMEGAFKERLAEARRGSPKCSKDNALVRVRVLDGAETLLLLQPFSDSEGSSPSLAAGTEFQGPEIDQFLARVGRYYRSRSECRFDYDLEYRTDSDYRRARTRFEQYFYPAKIKG